MDLILEKGLLARNALAVVKQRNVAIKSPYDVGRLPLKVASKFAGFKADQWRNWIIMFSELLSKVCCLHPIIIAGRSMSELANSMCSCYYKE